MDAFDRQVMDRECRAVKLLDAAKTMAAGQPDGILTRDYIYLADAHNMVIKIADLKAACLVKQTLKVDSMPVHKELDYLTVMLLSRNGVRAITECSKESGTALILALQERNLGIYTADGNVITDEAFGRLR